ncbi:hypothetical protein KHS38_11730 [Mucilaginibacter sp. Bleaf8]|uniref:hypothetical protein n=1 Tax=Mucilaginibacter sp. Bleaf8 TaxID=2834430 RepID=UPI001BCE3392|nr:hypothetical protein [Mucilaginibacter sp. Bleaf8]MBS7565075.1 hypothetical protein [Mucilaginibacter sp. Bleaf8]
MTLFEIFTYFENYAIRHHELQHVPDDDSQSCFTAANTEEDSAENLIKACERELVMVLLPYEKTMLPVKQESFIWGKTIVFLVLKKVSRSSPKEVIQGQSQCEEIANDFISQVIADRMTKLCMVDLDSFHMAPVGPIADDRYGYICMFNLQDYFEHWVKPERWSA